MTYVMAGSLGAVGMVPNTEEPNPMFEDDRTSDEICPCDAEALGDHIVAAFEQARTMVQ